MLSRNKGMCLKQTCVWPVCVSNNAVSQPNSFECDVYCCWNTGPLTVWGFFGLCLVAWPFCLAFLSPDTGYSLIPVTSPIPPPISLSLALFRSQFHFLVAGFSRLLVVCWGFCITFRPWTLLSVFWADTCHESPLQHMFSIYTQWVQITDVFKLRREAVLLLRLPLTFGN